MVTLGDAHTLKPVADREAPSLHPIFFRARALGHRLAECQRGSGVTARLQQVGAGGGRGGAQLCNMDGWPCPVPPGGRPPAVLWDPKRVHHLPTAQEGTTPVHRCAPEPQPRRGPASGSHHQPKEHRAQGNALSPSLMRVSKSQTLGTSAQQTQLLGETSHKGRSRAGGWPPQCIRPTNYTSGYTLG